MNLPVLRRLAPTSFLLLCLLAGCGVDRVQHVLEPSADASLSDADAGARPPDAGESDAGAADAGAATDAGADDAGAALDAGAGDAGEVDAGADAGPPGCTTAGVSPELQALPGGPYQNCQGGTIPRTDVQMDTQPWSGCCGDLMRVCQVTGYSMQNVIYCR